MGITWVPFVVVRQSDVWRRVTMASVVAILDVKGKPLIQRSYRDDVDSSAIERFLPLVLEIEEEHGAGAVQPCMTSQGVNYMHVRHNNLYRAYASHLPSARTFATQLECCRDPALPAQTRLRA